MNCSRTRPIVALAIALPLAVGTPAKADEYCQYTENPVASVLVIHGGGWYGGSAKSTGESCSLLAELGYRARSLEYPLRTVPGSIEYAQRAAVEEARLGRPVYALGISAGGTIAEYLALQPDIDGAVAVGPLSNLVHWQELWPGFWDGLGMSLGDRYRWSPYYNIRRPAPLRIIHSLQDEAVPYEQSVRMAGRCGDQCELTPLPGGSRHALSLGWQAATLEWFERRAGQAGFSRAAPAPVISRAALRPRTFSVRSSDRRERRRRGGTRFRYTLSEAARVTFNLVRANRGARERTRCPSAVGGAQMAIRCSAHQLGSFAVQARAGSNSTPFAGRLGGRALRPGRYRAVLRATSSSGTASKPRSLYFRIVSRTRPRQIAHGPGRRSPRDSSRRASAPSIVD